jgi:hypothetical protein
MISRSRFGFQLAGCPRGTEPMIASSSSVTRRGPAWRE